ncbi:MAG: hypothetical protein H0T55_03455, partial [Rubrobacteraceae bacterium]|nr:hypothetical protein [Rubrobacteraceae bacterium]
MEHLECAERGLLFHLAEQFGAEGIPSTTPHQVSLLQNRISSGSSGISNEPQS